MWVTLAGRAWVPTSSRHSVAWLGSSPTLGCPSLQPPNHLRPAWLCQLPPPPRSPPGFADQTESPLPVSLQLRSAGLLNWWHLMEKGPTTIITTTIMTTSSLSPLSSPRPAGGPAVLETLIPRPSALPATHAAVCPTHPKPQP